MTSLVPKLERFNFWAFIRAIRWRLLVDREGIFLRFAWQRRYGIPFDIHFCIRYIVMMYCFRILSNEITSITLFPKFDFVTCAHASYYKRRIHIFYWIGRLSIKNKFLIVNSLCYDMSWDRQTLIFGISIAKSATDVMHKFYWFQGGAVEFKLCTPSFENFLLETQSRHPKSFSCPLHLLGF